MASNMTIVTVLILAALVPIFYACRGDNEAQALLFVMFIMAFVPMLMLGLPVTIL